MQKLNDGALPKQTRTEIYKKAISVYQKLLGIIDKHDDCIPEDVYGMENKGLCLLLPCIYYNLKHYCRYPVIDGEKYIWEYEDTPIAFPEMKDVISKINGNSIEEKNRQRLKLLEEILSSENI